MSRRIAFLLVCVLVMPAVGFGQTPDRLAQETGGRVGTARLHLSDQTGSSGRFRLFDPARLSMSQQYTMRVAAGGAASRAQGLYVNSLHYQLSSNARMTVHLGYLHQLSSPGNGRGVAGQNRLLPGFELTYRPSKNVLIQVNYGTYGSQDRYGLFGPYDNRWDLRSRASSSSLFDSWFRDEDR